MEGDARLRSGLLKGVEIHHHHVDGDDTVLGHGGLVGWVVTNVQDPAVHLGMQRFDAAIEHLGKAGEIGDVLDGESGIAQCACRAARRDEFHAVICQRATEFDQSGLIGNAEQRATNRLPSAGLLGFALRGLRIRLRLCVLRGLHGGDLSFGVTSKV